MTDKFYETIFIKIPKSNVIVIWAPEDRMLQFGIENGNRITFINDPIEVPDAPTT
jgi:hypothetical protein